MLTMHSFMFISSYENLRSYLRERVRIDILAHLGPGLFGVGNPGTLQTVAYVLSRETNMQARNDSVGTYFRLVKEPVGEAKRRRFEQALSNLHVSQSDVIVYRYGQGDFDAIPGGPWVYYLPNPVLRLLHDCRSLVDVASPRAGMHGGDRFRFARHWWEVGLKDIGKSCDSEENFGALGKKWCPYVKGGAFRKWWGNQEWVIAFDKAHRAILSECGNRLPNRELYFHSLVGCSKVTSATVSFRLYPRGFIFADAVSCIFSNELDLYTIIGFLNSRFCRALLKAISPTVNFEAGHLGKMPVPNAASRHLNDYVANAIEISRFDCYEDEISWDFIAPPAWETGLDDVAERHHRLAGIEREIDEEVYRLYGVSDEDRVAIEAELAEPTANDASDAESEDFSSDTEDAEAAEEAPLIRNELSRRWISYAAAIVMGRFQPGIDGALGRGHFSEDIAVKLRALADSDGILVFDQGHPDDLPTKVLKALQLMLGQDAVAEVVAEATSRGGNPEEELRRYFERTFFKEHIQKYRKRPVYWLLQSPGKTYGVWLFHENLTKDTLYRISSKQYVAQKIDLLETNIADLRKKRDVVQGRERRALEKPIAEVEDVLDDLRAFAERIEAILQRGYTPHIDDGVLITMAPLWELIPSWQAEPKKCWEALAQGDYDWSHQAMDHWPERVCKKCQTNKSYAIAHVLA